MVDIDKIQFGFVPGRGTTNAFLLFASCRNSTELSKSHSIFAVWTLKKLLTGLPERCSDGLLESWKWKSGQFVLYTGLPPLIFSVPYIEK